MVCIAVSDVCRFHVSGVVGRFLRVFACGVATSLCRWGVRVIGGWMKTAPLHIRYDKSDADVRSLLCL